MAHASRLGQWESSKLELLFHFVSAFHVTYWGVKSELHLLQFGSGVLDSWRPFTSDQPKQWGKLSSWRCSKTIKFFIFQWLSCLPWIIFDHFKAYQFVVLNTQKANFLHLLQFWDTRSHHGHSLRHIQGVPKKWWFRILNFLQFSECTVIWPLSE